jgi:2-polyprenyl-3-methyl-5-hydroxy-6-metoxy-1,4-benzoquinol methylase
MDHTTDNLDSQGDACCRNEHCSASLAAQPSNELTDVAFWKTFHTSNSQKVSLPSRLSVFNRDFHGLLRKYIQPNAKVLEVGCAPGRQLAWVAKHLQAKVAGLDFVPEGIDIARQLFDSLGMAVDLRCEDIFSSTFTDSQFDVVYSAGFIEHFGDPGPMVRRHVELVKPGGVALITIPNYTGVYKRIQHYFDPGSLKIHNLDIMSCKALAGLAPPDLSGEVTVFPAGRLGSWLISFHKKWPRFWSKFVGGSLHLIGLLQPVSIPLLNSLWVLVIVRKDSTDLGENDAFRNEIKSP